MRTRLNLTVAAIAAVAMLVAGCGGNSGDSADTTVPGRPTTTASGSGSGSTGDEGAGSGDIDAGNTTGTAEDCRLLGEAFTNNGAAEAMSKVMSDGSDPTDAFRRGAEALDGVKDKVSSDLAEPVGVLAETYSELADATSKLDWKKLTAGDPAEAAKLADFTKLFRSQAAADAANELTTWTNENCIPG